MRLVGVQLPRKKRIDIGLRKIFGIGKTTASKILAITGICPQKLCGELNPNERERLRAELAFNNPDRRYLIEGSLKRIRSQNIKRLIKIRCIRGRRHQRGLPVRGQRTRTNAQTRKKKRT